MEKKLNREERKDLLTRSIVFRRETEDYRTFKDWTKEAREEETKIMNKMDAYCLTCARPYGEGETISAGYIDCDRCARGGFD